MAALVKSGSRICLSQFRSAVLYQTTRNHWNRDWKPGKYPETREEREAAAKKYGLLPEEYQPYKRDGMESGDYPKLPDIAAEDKDPYYPWDFPEHKRNFNEPLHSDFDMIGEDRVHISYKPDLPGWFKLVSFLSAVLGSFAIGYLVQDYPVIIPVLPKQLYKPGEVHYTFESK